MTVQHEEMHEAMNETRTVTQPPVDDHLDKLLVSELEVPWHTSFINQIKETINPPKLPPLEVTSKPVAVKDIWNPDGKNKR